MKHSDRHASTEPVQRTVDAIERTGQPRVVLYGSSRFVASGVAKKIKQNLENYGYAVTRRYPDMPGTENDISVAKNITSGDVVLAGVDVEMFGDGNAHYNEWLRTHPRVGYFTFQSYVKPSDGGPFSAGAEINSTDMISENEDTVAAYIAYKFDIMCQGWGIDSVKRKISGQLATTLSVPSRITGMAGDETVTPAVSPPPLLQQLESKEFSYEEAATSLINIMKVAPQITCFFLKQQVPELYMTISKDMDAFKKWFLLQYGIELEIEFSQAPNFKDPPEKGSFVIKNIQAKAFENPVMGTVCRVRLMRAMENLLKGFEKKIPVEVPAALIMMINMMLLTRQLQRKGSPFLYKSFNHVNANIVRVEEPEYTPAFVQSIYNEQTYPEVIPLVERIYQCYQQERNHLEKAKQADSPLINEAIRLIDECIVSVIFIDDEMLAEPGFMKLVEHTNGLEGSGKRIHFIPLTDLSSFTKIQRIAGLRPQDIFPTTGEGKIGEIFGTGRFTTEIRNTFSPNETIAIISSTTPRAQMIASKYDKSLTIPRVGKGVVSKRNSLGLPL